MFKPNFLRDRKLALLKKVSECVMGFKAARVSLKETTGVLCEPTSDVADMSVAENCIGVATFNILENLGTTSCIVTALEHLDNKDGQYGVCVDCGDEIPEKRLIAIPWAQRCIKCQEEFEARVRGEVSRKKGEEDFNFNLVAAVNEL